jgi:hypothetical protein
MLPRRPRSVAWIAAGAAAVAALVLGLVITSPASKDREPSGGSGPSLYETIACARQILVGRTVSVRPGSRDGLQTVVFEVEEWIKPAEGPATITLVDTVDTEAVEMYPAWGLEMRRLLFVPLSGRGLIEQITEQQGGVDRFARSLKRSLPRGLRTECPAEFRS